MKRLFKYLAGAISVLFILIVAAIVWLSLLDPNDHKDWISNKFQQQTGRQLSLNGNIELNLYPWFGLHLEQVSISDDPAFSDSPFFSTELAEIRLKLLPAVLSREYTVDTVRLHDTQINLITTSAGNNWDSLSRQDPDSETEADTSDQSGFTMPHLTIGGIDISNFNVHYEDRQQGTEYNIENLNLKADELIYGEPLSFLMTFTASSNQPALAANATLNATVTYDLQNESYAIAPLDASAMLAGPDVPQGYESMNLHTMLNINLDEGTLAIPELMFSGLGNNLEASLEAANLNADNLRLYADLNANGPNLPLLLSVTGRISGGPESPLATYGQALNQLNDKSFQARATVEADMENGNLNLTIPEVSGLGFTLTGDVQGQDIDQDDGSFSGQLNLDGRNLKPLLAALELPVADTLEALSVDVGLSGTPRSLQMQPLQATLDLRGSSVPNGSASIQLQANPRLDLEDGTLEVPQYALTGLGLDINGTLSGNNIFEAPAFNGELHIPELNLRELITGLGMEPPVSADNTTLQRFSLDADFTSGPELSGIDPLLINLDDTTLQGNASVNAAENGLISFALQADTLNLDRYLPPPAGEEESSASDDTGSGELPLDSLRNLNIDGTIQVADLTVSNLKLSNTELTLAAHDGQISLDPVGTDLYDGSYRGSMNLDVSSDEPRAAMSGNLSTVNLEPLLQDFMQADYVSGIANISLNVTGRGSDADSFKRTLSGSGNLSLTDGVLKGVDVSALLQQLEIMIEEQRRVEVDRGEETAFDSFTSSFNISNGVVTTDDLQMLAPGFRVNGNGTLLNLQDETIDFRLLTTVDESTATNAEETYDIGGYEVPIACSGVISSPRCLPELGAIIQAAISTAVERRVGDFLQRALGGDEEEAAGTETDTTEEDDNPLNRLRGLFGD